MVVMHAGKLFVCIRDNGCFPELKSVYCASGLCVLDFSVANKSRERQKLCCREKFVGSYNIIASTLYSWYTKQLCLLNTSSFVIACAIYLYRFILVHIVVVSYC